VIERGSICWAEPPGSGDRRPVLEVQADAFNRSRIPTVLVVPLVRNLRLLEAPGNVLVDKGASGLAYDAVANVAQVLTLERRLLRETPAQLPDEQLASLDDGLRLVLGLGG
jgi:mRNA interferase MazF